MKNSIKKYQFGNPIKWGQNDWKPVTPQLISDTVNKRKLDKKPVIYYKKGDSNESFPVIYENWDEAVENSSWARGSYDDFLEMRSPEMPNIMSYPVNILPEVVVEGYRPIKLRTYYPGNKWYPLTGHSRLEIPFNKDEYIDVNKGFNDKGYNLVTNNCSNLTYNFLSKMFGKNEDFNLFTTPGDVREFAIKKLGGKPKMENGIDTVIIPRDGQNVSPGTLAVRATMLANKALKNDDERYSGSTYMYYKKGGGIHIKKKNRGKFTEYCGGKVTDECIRKAKNSGNPTLVKRATFALNSRKWKHLKGGYIIKSQEGTKFNFGKITNFLNSDLGKLAIQGISLIINKINDAKMELELLDWKKNFLKSVTPNTSLYYQKVEDEENQLKQMNPDYNSSPIVTAYKANKLAQEDYLSLRQAAEQEADLYIREQLSNNQGYGDLLSTGLGLIGSFLSKKNNNSSINLTKPNSSSNWTKPNYSNNYTFKLSSFWDNPTLLQ